MGITILGGINQGLIWALLAIGVFVTFRILDFADLTVEGSFALGGLIAALFINNLSLNPFLATFVAMLAGGVAGFQRGAAGLGVAVHLVAKLGEHRAVVIQLHIQPAQLVVVAGQPLLEHSLLLLGHTDSVLSIMICTAG